MVILFDTLSILFPVTVLENCLETPELKPFSTSCAKLKCPLFVQLESFLKRKPWWSSVSSSFEDLLPRLTFTCFCFIYETVPLVFICRVVTRGGGGGREVSAGADDPPLSFMCPFNLRCIAFCSKPWSDDGVSLSNAPLRCYNSNEVYHSLKHLTNFKSNKRRQMRLNLSFLTK